MDNFSTARHTAFLFGRQQELELGRQVKYYGGTRVLLVSSTRANISGLTLRLSGHLVQSGLKCVTHVLKHGVPGIKEILDAIKTCQDEQVDFVVAVGDGNAFSFGKAVCAGSAYVGDAIEVLEGREPADTALALGVVVTVPGSGMELNSHLMIAASDAESRMRRLSAESLIPRFAIINPDLCDCFPRHTGSVTANILTHGVEIYFNNPRCIELTERICEGILLTSVNMLRKLGQTPMDCESRANLAWAGVMIHSDFAMEPEHLNQALERLAWVLMARYGCSHARACALLLPAWLEYVAQFSVMKVARFTHRVLGAPLDFEEPLSTVRLGVRTLRMLMEEAGMPRSLADLGGRGVDIGRLVQNIAFDDEGCIGTYVRMDREACEVVLSQTLHARTPGMEI